MSKSLRMRDTVCANTMEKMCVCSSQRESETCVGGRSTQTRRRRRESAAAAAATTSTKNRWACRRRRCRRRRRRRRWTLPAVWRKRRHPDPIFYFVTFSTKLVFFLLCSGK